MIFTCSTENFAKILNIADNIIASKNNISILSNVLIEAKGENIFVTASNGNLDFYGSIKADIEEEGSITVFSNKLFSIIRKLPSEEVTIESKEYNNITIQPKGINKITYNLKGIDPAKFPPIKKIDENNYLEINQSIFIDMLKKTEFAVSQNDNKKFANGILFENKDNKFKMVATDGKRLTKIEKNVGFNSKNIDNIIVPYKILNEVSKVCSGNGTIKFNSYDKNIYFNVDNYYFIMPLLEATFPPYESVIPKENKIYLKVNKNLLKDSIERISLITDKDYHKIIFNIEKNQMKIFTESITIGSGEEIIDIEYNGENIKIALNFNYVLDVLNVLTNNFVEFKLNDSQSTITITEFENKDYIYIMMPMAI